MKELEEQSISEHKRSLHKELLTTFNAYLESLLAAAVLEEPKGFSSVTRVSQSILDFIQKNENEVENIIAVQPKIKDWIYSEEYFGHLESSQADVSAKDILSDIYRSLSLNNNVAQMALIHGVFIQYIYAPIVEGHKNQKILSKKEKLVNIIFGNQLFQGSRGRTEKVVQPNRYTRLGITDNSFFAKKIDGSDSSHLRAKDRFMADKDNQFTLFLEENNLPFVAGPSGHAGSFLLGALLYGDLSRQQLKEYILMTGLTLIAGGNHSFSEIICVVNCLSSEAIITSYKDGLPASFFNTKTHQKFEEEHPGFLSNKFPIFKIN